MVLGLLNNMGNETSTEPSTTGEKDVIAFAPHSTGKNLDGPTQQQSRRIVKAAKPSASPIPPDVEVSPPPSQEEGEDEEGIKDKRWEHVPHPIAESPSIAREMEQELVEQQKKERIETAKDRQRASRQKKLQERREGHKESNVKPNPMSRFLSAFSVEPTHPEHKRSLEKDVSSRDVQEPCEKRIRHSQSGQLDSDEPSDNEEEGQHTGKESSFWTPSTVASVVAVAAIAVGVLLRWNRQK